MRRRIALRVLLGLALIALRGRAHAVYCGDERYCDDDQTCCKSNEAATHFFCCEAKGATCCSDMKSCCPPEFPICDLQAGGCVGVRREPKTHGAPSDPHHGNHHRRLWEERRLERQPR